MLPNRDHSQRATVWPVVYVWRSLAEPAGDHQPISPAMATYHQSLGLANGLQVHSSPSLLLACLPFIDTCTLCFFFAYQFNIHSSFKFQHKCCLVIEVFPTLTPLLSSPHCSHKNAGRNGHPLLDLTQELNLPLSQNTCHSTTLDFLSSPFKAKVFGQRLSYQYVYSLFVAEHLSHSTHPVFGY